MTVYSVLIYFDKCTNAQTAPTVHGGGGRGALGFSVLQIL